MQLEPEQGITGSSGSSGIMIQLLTSPVQRLQEEPEQGGTGVSGQSIDNPHPLPQTWKSQVLEIIQLESWTNRWHCLQGQEPVNKLLNEKLCEVILYR